MAQPREGLAIERLVRVALLATEPTQTELADALGRHARFDVVAAEPSVDDCRLRLAARDPDVVVVAGANGLLERSVAEVRRLLPRTCVVVCGPSAEQHHAARVGAAGFVSLHVSFETLIAVIEAAARGEALYATAASERPVRDLDRFAASADDLLTNLSAREQEILALKPTHSNKAIAYKLRISLSTTKNHVHSVFAKLGLHRRRDAVEFARALRAAMEREI